MDRVYYPWDVRVPQILGNIEAQNAARRHGYPPSAAPGGAMGIRQGGRWYPFTDTEVGRATTGGAEGIYRGGRWYPFSGQSLEGYVVGGAKTALTLAGTLLPVAAIAAIGYMLLK